MKLKVILVEHFNRARTKGRRMDKFDEKLSSHRMRPN